MHLLPDYPAAAITQHAQDICQMHVTVSATGAVSAVEFTQSTGSAALDQSCKDVIYESPFFPATNGGQPVIGSTDVAIDWRLPR
jgi:TonB family protein